jgi:hypothetical protein
MDRPEPSAHPLLNVSRQDLNDQHQVSKCHPSAPTNTSQCKIRHPEPRTGDGWTRAGSILNKAWTVETLSFIVSILALVGLVATLLTHQHKPLPQWPQLVNINSIISLFVLVMRSSVATVLAEGISQCKWNWYQKAKKLDHMARLDSASRGSWGSLVFLFHFRLRRV